MFGKPKSSIPGDWDFYSLLVDDEPASIFVNLAERQVAPDQVYGHMGYLRIRMRSPREDGLSSQEEFETLAALEDDVVPFVEAKGRARFVGRNTSGGHRDFYFYTRSPKAFDKAIEKRMQRHAAYSFESRTREDQAWNTYLNFLLPSPRDFQRIMNRRVRDSLEQHGDLLGVAREIDHLVYFPTNQAAESFAELVRNEGFIVREIRKLDDPNRDAHSVDFYRSDSPNSMDEVVFSVLAWCEPLSGHYDGWGCGVVTENSQT